MPFHKYRNSFSLIFGIPKPFWGPEFQAIYIPELFLYSISLLIGVLLSEALSFSHLHCSLHRRMAGWMRLNRKEEGPLERKPEKIRPSLPVHFMKAPDPQSCRESRPEEPPTPRVPPPVSGAHCQNPPAQYQRPGAILQNVHYEKCGVSQSE